MEQIVYQYSTKREGDLVNGLAVFLALLLWNLRTTSHKISQLTPLPSTSPIFAPSSNAAHSKQGIQNTVDDAVFMQDNAPIHKAGIVEECFDNMNYQVDDHPAYSPDRNLLEHV